MVKKIWNLNPIRNSLIIGGISFFSYMGATGGLPTLETIYAGSIAFGLSFCVELANGYDIKIPENKKGNAFFFKSIE